MSKSQIVLQAVLNLADITSKIKSEIVNQFTPSMKDIVDDIVPAMKTITKDMVNAVYKIDTAMSSLHMVTNETSATYNQFLDGATSKAQELGRSVSDLIDQTTKWVKLGFSLDESAKLSESSSIYANTSGINDDDAIKNMHTAMKANIHALIHGNMYIEYI